jgi:hypothetical protein
MVVDQSEVGSPNLSGDEENGLVRRSNRGDTDHCAKQHE